jgi:glycosyltransferase involved in cell wall biosynthesis
MRYSVVIPAYQAAATVAAAVRSALAQELAPIEVVVVDDGSRDGTADAAAEAGARVIRQLSNQGAAVARNIGLAAATASHVALLDADDTWFPGHLQAIDAAFTAVPQARVAFGGVTKVGPFGSFDVPIPVPVHQLLHPLGMLLRRNHVPLSAAVVERRAALAAGGFDPSYQITYDYNLWLRLAPHVGMVRAEGIGLRYVVHPGQLSRNYPLLLEESWRARFAAVERIAPEAAARHAADLLAGWELDLLRSWNRRSPAELDQLLAMAPLIPGSTQVARRWQRRRRAFPWLRAPLAWWDHIPRGLRTRVARLRGNYEYDLVG